MQKYFCITHRKCVVKNKKINPHVFSFDVNVHWSKGAEVWREVNIMAAKKKTAKKAVKKTAKKVAKKVTKKKVAKKTVKKTAKRK